jgi:hypothetical protein
MAQPAQDPEFDKLIGFAEGETWLGFDTLRTDTPESNLTRLIFQIRESFSEDSLALVTLDSDVGVSEVEITTASTWAATVKSRILQTAGAVNLQASDREYVWSLWVETAAGDAYTYAVGSIKGGPPYTLVP